ncbi:MAG: hypothetical protein Cons2KO_33150 [Congregibacter sp.]
MSDTLLRRYREYANSENALAVLFVKKNLPQAKGHWIDIANCRRYEMSSDDLHFRYVLGGLYRRKIRPEYPPRSAFTFNGEFDERRYLFLARAITWETANKDIAEQRSKNVSGWKFKITGVSYDKNRDCKNFFRDDAPSEIKALATDLADRTNPLWDVALQYANKPEFVYEIKRVDFTGRT